MLHFNEAGWSHISLNVLVHSLKRDKYSSQGRQRYCMLQQNANAFQQVHQVCKVSLHDNKILLAAVTYRRREIILFIEMRLK